MKSLFVFLVASLIVFACKVRLGESDVKADASEKLGAAKSYLCTSKSDNTAWLAATYYKDFNMIKIGYRFKALESKPHTGRACGISASYIQTPSKKLVDLRVDNKGIVAFSSFEFSGLRAATVIIEGNNIVFNRCKENEDVNTRYHYTRPNPSIYCYGDE